MTERDPLWENVTGYMGPIRNYDPNNWTYLKQEDLLEFYIEVRVGDHFAHSRILVERRDVDDCHMDLVKFTLDKMVEQIDKRIKRYRKEK